jgi:hypothetical protein
MASYSCIFNMTYNWNPCRTLNWTYEPINQWTNESQWLTSLLTRNLTWSVLFPKGSLLAQVHVCVCIELLLSCSHPYSFMYKARRSWSIRDCASKAFFFPLCYIIVTSIVCHSSLLALSLPKAECWAVVAKSLVSSVLLGNIIARPTRVNLTSTPLKLGLRINPSTLGGS